jgi:hypothetical protein
VTFADGSDDTELLEAAISRGLDVTNLYLAAIFNAPKVLEMVGV